MQLSEAEWKVMRVVWRKSPVNAREICEALEPDTQWAYSTVKTLLTRLGEKGAVTISMRANRRWFEPAVSRKRAQRSALRSLLDRAFDGTFGSLVQHLAHEEQLSAEQREALEAIAHEPLEDASE
jgi:BlaI family penicillinase repressor